MGRYRYGSKQEADDLKQFSVSFLRKYGYFRSSGLYGTIKWSRNGTPTGNITVQSYINDNERCLRLIYTQTDRQTGEKTHFDYKIPLVTTPCYFGGFRYWFQCPWYAQGIFCGRRVGVLYLGDKYFACRHCYHLTYASRKLSGYWKTIGSVISMPDLENMESKIKRKWYAGKMTKRYRRYLKKDEKALRQLVIAAGGLNAIRKLEKT